ncbi:MAG: 30S ribosomal protein S6 [Acidobacteria bacterium]|nr:MAG: 30S ribosomal protein S6 [Acidobacteriota bacterium]RPJ76337.1 MAG: 30S ribosomal protein S6 [Acidobacteriota bacterium]
MSTSRQYELVYIVSPEASEQEVTDLHTQVETQIARIGGELVKSENWGRRKMAYEIGPHKEGVYVLELINGSGELMKELERRLRVSERVLRYLVVRVDEELRAAERTRSRRKVRTGPPEGSASDEMGGFDRADDAEVR